MSRDSRAESPLGYFHNERGDLAAFVERAAARRTKPIERALEVGCAAGVLGGTLKRSLGVSRYVGVELARGPAEEARSRLDEVHQGNVEALCADGDLAERLGGPFDLVLFADVLEHLVDPWAVIRHMADAMREGGWLVGSIPNAGNASMVFRLIADRFEYEDSGLFDRTHLRFFTESTVRSLVEERFRLVELERRQPRFAQMPVKQRALYAALGRIWPLGFVSGFWFIAEKRP